MRRLRAGAVQTPDTGMLPGLGNTSDCEVGGKMGQGRVGALACGMQALESMGQIELSHLLSGYGQVT